MYTTQKILRKQKWIKFNAYDHYEIDCIGVRSVAFAHFCMFCLNIYFFGEKFSHRATKNLPKENFQRKEKCLEKVLLGKMLIADGNDRVMAPEYNSRCLIFFVFSYFTQSWCDDTDG